MTPNRTFFLKAASALLLTTANCLAQTPASPQPGQQQPQTRPAPPKQLPAFYRNLILLDPAHGGADTGAQLPNNVLEKDVTLTFAQRLRPALAAQGFTVIYTRDSESATTLTTDQRAGTANHAHPLACILLHATATGTGIHIASSSLTPLGEASSPSRAIPWATAQAQTVPMSLRLANEIGLALFNAHLPAILLRASVPPVDNLICPVITIELAPLVPSSGNPSPVTDATYQQRTVDAIATALASFRSHNAPAPSALPTAPALALKPTPTADPGVAK